jgi:hypothetical protein
MTHLAPPFALINAARSSGGSRPASFGGITLPQGLFVVHPRIQIVLNEVSDSPLFRTTAARILQCSTRERDGAM